MSARHRQHKRKLAAAKAELAEREVDLVAYTRVLADMDGGPVSIWGDGGMSSSLRLARADVADDVDRLRAVVAELERSAPP